LSKDSFSDEAKLEEIIEGETDEYTYPKEFRIVIVYLP